MSHRRDAFPIEAARDVLGLLRAMYVVARDDGATARAGRIQKIATEVRKAIELAERYEPGTLGHSAAFSRADAVMRQLAEVVDCTTALEPVVLAASRRVSGLRANGGKS